MSEPKGHWEDGGKVWVEDHDCSLPESNTGECQTCNGRGEIGGLQRFGDGEVDCVIEPCPTCAVNARHAKSLREVATILSTERIQGWANPLVCVLLNAEAALAAADARIGGLDSLTKALASETLRAETAETARVKLWNDCRELRATIDVEKAVADSAVQDRETAETLLEEARRALEPFIRLADNVFSDGKNATVADEVTLWCFNDTDITFGDLRRARATLDRIGK